MRGRTHSDPWEPFSKAVHGPHARKERLSKVPTATVQSIGRLLQSDEELQEYGLKMTLAADALLLGRITYQGMAQAWRTRGGNPFADHVYSITKYVVASQPVDTTAWDPSCTDVELLVAYEAGPTDLLSVVHAILLSRVVCQVNEISLRSMETMSGSDNEWPSGVRGTILCFVGSRIPATST
jgi:hypothetical protein